MWWLIAYSLYHTNDIITPTTSGVSGDSVNRWLFQLFIVNLFKYHMTTENYSSWEILLIANKDTTRNKMYFRLKIFSCAIFEKLMEFTNCWSDWNWIFSHIYESAESLLFITSKYQRRILNIYSLMIEWSGHDSYSELSCSHITCPLRSLFLYFHTFWYGVDGRREDY